MVSRRRIGAKPPLTILVLATIVAVLAIAGCGGGSRTAAPGRDARPTGTTASTGSSPGAGAGATASFIARADAICRRVNTELAAANAKKTSFDEIVRVASRNATIERKGLVQLEALSVPGSISPTWQRILADRTALSKQLTGLVEDAQRKDRAAIKALGATKKRLHAHLTKAAKMAGFNDCTKVGSS